MYAVETIDTDDFVIEYIGEAIRVSLADARERLYQVGWEEGRMKPLCLCLLSISFSFYYFFSSLSHLSTHQESVFILSMSLPWIIFLLFCPSQLLISSSSSLMPTEPVPPAWQTSQACQEASPSR